MIDINEIAPYLEVVLSHYEKDSKKSSPGIKGQLRIQEFKRLVKNFGKENVPLRDLKDNNQKSLISDFKEICLFYQREKNETRSRLIKCLESTLMNIFEIKEIPWRTLDTSHIHSAFAGTVFKISDEKISYDLKRTRLNTAITSFTVEQLIELKELPSPRKNTI